VFVPVVDLAFRYEELRKTRSGILFSPHLTFTFVNFGVGISSKLTFKVSYDMFTDVQSILITLINGQNKNRKGSEGTTNVEQAISSN